MNYLTEEEIGARLIEVAAQSPANKKKVGAIIARVISDMPNEYLYDIVSEGYNFNPDGGPCETEDNVAHPNVVHAEVNAILNLDKKHLKVKKAVAGYPVTVIKRDDRYIMFTTHEPCTSCQAHLMSMELQFKILKRVGWDKMTNSINETLKERGSRYGDFSDNALVSEGIMDLLRSQEGYQNLRPVHKAALNVMAQKMSRIVNGDPEGKDNWHDIEGYAKLAEDRCIEEGVTTTANTEYARSEFKA